jgi:hypothetical protein
VYPKCVKTHLRAFVISKFFPGVIPPFQGEGREGWGGRVREGREGERRGRKDWALLVFGPFRCP